MNYRYQYGLAPGFTITSRTYWSPWRILVAISVCGVVLYLATRTPAWKTLLVNEVWAPPQRLDLRSMQVPDHSHHTRHQSKPLEEHKPAAPVASNHQRHIKRRRLNKRVKRELLEHYRYRCAHCHIRLDKHNCDFDHSTPHAFAAWDNTVNNLNNFKPLCLRCHRIKTQAERKTWQYRSMLKQRRRQRCRRL